MALGLKTKAWLRAWKLYRANVSNPEGFTIHVEPSGDERPDRQWVAYYDHLGPDCETYGAVRHGHTAWRALWLLQSDMHMVWRRKKEERGHKETLAAKYDAEFPV